MQKCTLVCLCLIGLSLTAHAISYRSQNSGDWNIPQNWQTFNGSWVTATVPPGPNDDVTIRAGQGIIIATADALAFSVYVEPGAFLQLAGVSLSLTINNGRSGADFIVEGSYQDDAGSGAGNGTFFEGGATWQLGHNGTFIKTNNSSAARYRDFYEGGMSNIPASANWVIRYTGLGSPSFTTNYTFYPNLIFESVAGNWYPSSGFSRFQGISGTATIYGNLDVGGSGSGDVTIINENTYSSPIQINGACIIKSGSTLTNLGNSTGTGFALRGPLSVSGNLLISGISSQLQLNGFGTQQISGEGNITLSNLEVSNPNDVQLLRPLQVDFNLGLSIGNIILNAFDLTVKGTITGASSVAYIQTNGFGENAGGLILPVSGSVFFPVGNNSYNLAILTYNGGGDFKVRVEDVVWLNGEGSTPLLSGVVSRTWLVDGPVYSPYSLTLQWNEFDQRPGFDPDWCYIAHNPGSGWSAEFPGPASGLGPFTKTRSGMTQAGAFTVASGSILPVELTNFSAFVEKEHVLLEWQTAQEINFSHFEVEKSQDGKNFKKIGKVFGQGNTFEPHDYAFQDQHPLPGNNYYRLKQVDFGGQFDYSSIEVVTIKRGQALVRAFPTIAQHQVSVFFPPATPGVLQISSMSGHTFSTIPIPEDTNTLSLDIHALPKGKYVLIYRSNSGANTLRFIKI